MKELGSSLFSFLRRSYSIHLTIKGKRSISMSSILWKISSKSLSLRHLVSFSLLVHSASSKLSKPFQTKVLSGPVILVTSAIQIENCSWNLRMISSESSHPTSLGLRWYVSFLTWFMLKRKHRIKYTVFLQQVLLFTLIILEFILFPIEQPFWSLVIVSYNYPLSW